MEAKALLFLMNINKDIYYLFIDLFNDVSASDKSCDRIWDLQSKASKNLSGKTLGRCLITLYCNYCSDINFEDYILFVGGVSNSVRINNGLDYFDSNNIHPGVLESMKEGLFDECQKRLDLDTKWKSKTNISKFLEFVRIYVCKKNQVNLINEVFSKYSEVYVDNQICQDIFRELKGIQASLKDNSTIEGIELHNAGDALNLDRHIKSKIVILLILQRVINWNLPSKSIPHSLVDFYNNIPSDDKDEIIDNCKQCCIKSVFDNDNTMPYWLLFDNIFDLVNKNPDLSVEEIYHLIDNNVIDDCIYMDNYAVIYLISLVKDGNNYDNKENWFRKL